MGIQLEALRIVECVGCPSSAAATGHHREGQTDSKHHMPRVLLCLSWEFANLFFPNRLSSKQASEGGGVCTSAYEWEAGRPPPSRPPIHISSRDGGVPPPWGSSFFFLFFSRRRPTVKLIQASQWTFLARPLPGGPADAAWEAQRWEVCPGCGHCRGSSAVRGLFVELSDYGADPSKAECCWVVVVWGGGARCGR